jgi:eukaryotic-like serine/threonine-protein kinase
MADGGDETIDGLLREIAETPYVATVRKSIRPGVCLAGRFFIEKRLGGGGMGQVFAAFDQGRRTRVATKILGKLTPETIGHMKHEFRVASDLVHPNLVRLHELSSDGDEWFFTMDLVEGLSLPECGRRRGWAKPPADWLLHVFRQLAAGLGALHQAGVLHRDLKPGNFLIGDDDRVTLLDFGLARPLGPQQKADRSGTPYYMAPEQALGEPLTEAADWYAFGVVLYEALTGGLPFGGPKPEAVADAPAGLGPLCLDLMALDPAARPRDAEVLQRLGVAATGLPLASLEPPPVLIGRTAELGALSGSFAVARAGAPAIALVHGPSGIGKTALVEEFLRTAGGAGALVLRGRCRERESMSHKAVDGLIDGIVELLDRLPVREALALLPPDIAQLTVLFPALRAATAVARRVRKRPAVADRALLRRQAIGAFVGLLARFRERGPLCIFIDDLQWSDADSAALLGPVLGGPAKVPLLFIGSYRREAGTRGPLLDALFADRALTPAHAHDAVAGAARSRSGGGAGAGAAAHGRERRRAAGRRDRPRRRRAPPVHRRAGSQRAPRRPRTRHDVALRPRAGAGRGAARRGAAPPRARRRRGRSAAARSADRKRRHRADHRRRHGRSSAGATSRQGPRSGPGRFGRRAP